MSYEQDLKEHGIKETNFNRWYEKNYDEALERVRNNYLFFEGVVTGYFPEIAESVDNLEEIHKKFVNGPIFVMDQKAHELHEQWLKDCDEETDRWLKEY